MATAAEQCWTAGRGYDPIGGVCVTRSGEKGSSGSLVYWDPESGTMLNTPPIAVGGEFQIQWTNPAASLPQAVRPVTGPPQPALQAGGIGDFLTQPGLLGFPVWTNIAAGAVLLFILSQMDGGGKGKSKGWI